MTNSDLLLEIIKQHGYKISYVASYLGLSRAGFSKKVRNVNPFTIPEADRLCHLLGIKTLRDKERIFFAKNVDYKATTKDKEEQK